MLASAAPLPIVFTDVTIEASGTRPLHGLSLSIDAGAPSVIVGPNGSGKTTLLRAAAGLIRPTRGRISWASQPSAPASQVAIVFQRPVMLRRSSGDNIRYALVAAGVPAERREQRTADLLSLVGLGPLAGRPARRLSGGEQQRLALARALARDPRVLLLDEPTSSLDPAASQEIEDLIVGIGARGVKVVMATHDLGEARRLGGEIVLLNRGTVVERGPSEAFFRCPQTDGGRRFLNGELLV